MSSSDTRVRSWENMQIISKKDNLTRDCN